LVVPPLTMQITVESPCPEDASFAIETHAVKGIPNFYSLKFGEKGASMGFAAQSDSLKGGVDNTITVLMPSGVKPGFYPFSIHFDSQINGTTDVDGELAVRYSASLIQQRWDDVLGILNAENNGGYDFRTFQWYRNGVAISGATDSYLYVSGKLKPGDAYSVEMKQEGETRSLSTCEYTVPVLSSAPAAAPTKQIQNGSMYIIINGRTYNAQGVLVNFIY